MEDILHTYGMRRKNNDCRRIKKIYSLWDVFAAGKFFSWQNEDHKERFIRIEFSYNGVYYQMCREPGEGNEMPILPDRRIGRYDVMICHWAMF